MIEPTMLARLTRALQHPLLLLILVIDERHRLQCCILGERPDIWIARQRSQKVRGDLYSITHGDVRSAGPKT